MPKPRPKKAKSEALVCAMRLRVYPTAGQERRGAQWLFVAHRFRNELVEFLEKRRKARGRWVYAHPALARGWIPEEFSGADTTAASKWLTARLEQARACLRLEGGVQSHKNALGHAVGGLSRGEIAELEDAWVVGIPRTILDNVIQDAKKTIAKAIHDRVEKKKQKSKSSKKLAGFPTFTKWRYATSVRLQVNAENNASFRDHWAAGEIFVPGLGRLKFRDTQCLPKTPPKLITVSRNASGHWHVSFACAEGEGLAKDWSYLSESLPLDESGLPKTDGFDLSLTSIAVGSDGKALGRVRHLKRQQSRHGCLSKHLARKRKGSGRWMKCARKLGASHVQVAGLREAGLKVHAQAVVRDNAIICLEDFALAFLLQNLCLASSAHDAALGRFRELIAWEAQKRGHLVIKCGRFDASSKTCSKCGHYYAELTIDERSWTCAGCATLHDRDENAAVNIRIMALRKALADLSRMPEMGIRALSSHRLKPELEAFLARGGLTALLEHHSSESRQGPGPLGQHEADETRISPQPSQAARRERTA